MSAHTNFDDDGAEKRHAEAHSVCKDVKLVSEFQLDGNYLMSSHNSLKACIDHIVAAFKKEARPYSRREGQELTYANYFKSQRSIAPMVNCWPESQTLNHRTIANFGLSFFGAFLPH